MENYNFILENIRFYLGESDTVIFNGWFRDDNPDGRVIEAYLDDKKLNIDYENKRGIEVRQKYLARSANVSEEIYGLVKLPEQWKQAKELRILTEYQGKRVDSLKISTAKLAERQNR